MPKSITGDVTGLNEGTASYDPKDLADSQYHPYMVDGNDIRTPTTLANEQTAGNMRGGQSPTLVDAINMLFGIVNTTPEARQKENEALNNFIRYAALRSSFGPVNRQAENINNIQRGLVDSSNPYDRRLVESMRQNQLAVAQAIANQERQNISGAQGARALGQATQQAMMQGGRAGQLSAGNASQNMARDVAQARLAEVVRARAGAGGAYGALRSSDTRAFSGARDSAIRNAAQTNALRQFYAEQLYNLTQAGKQGVSELDRLNIIANMEKSERDAAAIERQLGLMGAIASLGISSGGKK